MFVQLQVHDFMIMFQYGMTSVFGRSILIYHGQHFWSHLQDTDIEFTKNQINGLLLADFLSLSFAHTYQMFHRVEGH